MTATIAPPRPFSVADRHDLDMFPVLSECTVAQAAQFLGNSEGYVEELLKDKTISFRTENGERFVQWDSLSAFERRRTWMRAGVDEIVRLSEEMGLYDAFLREHKDNI